MTRESEAAHRIDEALRASHDRIIEEREAGRSRATVPHRCTDPCGDCGGGCDLGHAPTCEAEAAHRGSARLDFEFPVDWTPEMRSAGTALLGFINPTSDPAEIERRRIAWDAFEAGREFEHRWCRATPAATPEPTCPEWECALNIGHPGPHRLAATPEQPPSLDVERLARAIEGHSHVGLPPERRIACDRGHVDGCADRIAAEYARLASEPIVSAESEATADTWS